MDAESVEQACGLLAEHGEAARVIAGGTDLLAALKDGIHPQPPRLLVNLKTIPGLDGIRREDDHLVVGALARLAEVARSEGAQEAAAPLRTAARAVGSRQIRTMGTLGGNLLQEVRCWYYRFPEHLGGALGCLRKGNGPCLAVKGDNRFHAIMGGRGCFAISPSDTAVALAALDAAVITAGPDGSRREIPVVGLFSPLGTALGEAEILTEVRTPLPEPGDRTSFVKHTVAGPLEFALLSAAVRLTIRDGVCEEARLVLGAVGPGPLRAREAEALLEGEFVDEPLAERVAAKALAAARPMKMNAYKVEIAKAVAKRALLTAAGSER